MAGKLPPSLAQGLAGVLSSGVGRGFETLESVEEEPEPAVDVRVLEL